MFLLHIFIVVFYRVCHILTTQHGVIIRGSKSDTSVLAHFDCRRVHKGVVPPYCGSLCISRRIMYRSHLNHIEECLCVNHREAFTRCIFCKCLYVGPYGLFLKFSWKSFFCHKIHGCCVLIQEKNTILCRFLFIYSNATHIYQCCGDTTCSFITLKGRGMMKRRHQSRAYMCLYTFVCVY